MAAHCQLRCTQPASNQWVQLHTSRTPAISQPSFDLLAQLQSDSCTWSFWSTWQSVGFGCSWSAELHFVSSAATFPINLKLSAQVHTFQPRCSFLARLQSVGLVAVSQHCCTVSPPLQLCLHYVSPAVVCQLGRILSAKLQSICSSVFCHAIHLLWQTSCKASAQLWSASSFAICHLSNLSARSWYVSLAAVC